MIQEIKGKDDYDAKHRISDVIWLIKTVKSIGAGIDDRTNRMKTYVDKLRDFSRLFQQQTETLDDYLKRFRSAALVLEDNNGSAVFLTDIITKYSDTRKRKKLSWLWSSFLEKININLVRRFVS